jgi:hypothetical protein
MKTTDSDRAQLFKAVQRYFKLSFADASATGDATPAAVTMCDTIAICIFSLWPRQMPYEELEKVMLKLVLPALALRPEEKKS